MKRRTFLKSAVSAATVVAGFPTIIPASALGLDGTVAPSNRVSMGFIGLGIEGRLKNLQRFIKEPEVHVAALCDVHEKRLHSALISMQSYAPQPSAAMARSCQVTRDWREVIARNDIDAVVISTPDHWHVLPAIAAATSGKDVFCEKPVSFTVREGRVLSDAIAKHNRIFQTGTENRSLPSFLRACGLVRNGHIGKLNTIRIEIYHGFGSECGTQNQACVAMPVPEDFDYDMWLGQAPEAPYTRYRCHTWFRYILDYAGGNLTDWGAHIFDIAQWGNDTEHTGPISVEGQGTFAQGGLFNAATDWELNYKYANGVDMICKSGMGLSIRFEGSDGWVQAGWLSFEASSAEIAKADPGAGAIHLRTCSKGEHRDFLDSIKSREPTYAPAEAGHRTASIAHIGNIALKLKRKLVWNPDTEQFSNDEEANSLLSRPMRKPWTLEA